VSLHQKINAHLAADGHSPAERLADLVSLPTMDLPRCLCRREEVLTRPPLISVVVATRDRPDSLRACLESLSKVRYQRFEIVVVDNNPTTDDTANLIANQYQSVHYVREDRPGLAAAHNCGLDAVQGEIVAFVDDDVLVDDQWLAAIAEGFAAADDVGCVTGLILPEQLETPAQLLVEHRGGYGKGFDLQIFDSGRNRPVDPLFPFAAGRLGSGANMAFNTEMLRSLGGFDRALGVGTFARGGDDLSGFFRVIVAGHRLVYQPSAIVWHRHHRDMAALRNMARGCGIGMGAFLTSSVVHEPKLLADLLRRLPAGTAHAFRRKAMPDQLRVHQWPANLVRAERRGLLVGPLAYGVSHWRAARFTAQVSRGRHALKERADR
jgi:GT2 family glycosyltransferase